MQTTCFLLLAACGFLVGRVSVQIEGRAERIAAFSLGAFVAGASLAHAFVINNWGTLPCCR